VTGGLDEVQIKDISDEWTYAVNLSDRKEEVLRLIEEQGKLTEELQQEIEKADQLQRVEDLYRPYRQKRRTRATVAKEKGLEPLAEQIWEQELENVSEEAEEYFSEEHELSTVEEVLAGANDIIAEWISDDAKNREFIRDKTFRLGDLVSEVKDESLDEKRVYEMYYDYREPVRTIVSHRTLAVNRGEKEDVLRIKIDAPYEVIIEYLEDNTLKQGGNKECVEILRAAIEDGYKRLIEPSIEREVRNQLTETAEEQAISVFSENLRNLLLQPPLKDRRVLGIDPAFRTGCKNAVIDPTGKVHAISVMYPTAPRNDVAGAEKIVLGLLKKHDIELIAIGNGTASRETEQFVADILQKHQLIIPYIIVNEAGASV